ncbi:CLUMA_CG019511, isoform A, partial [Clunio marinus]
LKSNSTSYSTLLNDEFWKITNIEKYLTCFHYMIYTLFLFSSDIEEETQIDMIIGIVFTSMGIILDIWLLSKAYMLIRTKYGPKLQFQEIRYQMREYMAFKRLGKSTKQRVLKFYDISFNGEFYRKREINDMLQKQLKHEVATELNRE